MTPITTTTAATAKLVNGLAMMSPHRVRAPANRRSGATSKISSTTRRAGGAIGASDSWCMHKGTVSQQAFTLALVERACNT